MIVVPRGSEGGGDGDGGKYLLNRYGEELSVAPAEGRWAVTLNEVLMVPGRPLKLVLNWLSVCLFEHLLRSWFKISTLRRNSEQDVLR